MLGSALNGPIQVLMAKSGSPDVKMLWRATPHRSSDTYKRNIQKPTETEPENRQEAVQATVSAAVIGLVFVVFLF
jgi:hypothetical protein